MRSRRPHPGSPGRTNHPGPLVAGVVSLLAMFVLIPGCAANRPRLEGAWECVEPAPQPGQKPGVKVLADGHFSFGTPPGDGQQLWAGGGTYTYEPQSGAYTETVTYHWLKALVG